MALYNKGITSYNHTLFVLFAASFLLLFFCITANASKPYHLSKEAQQYFLQAEGSAKGNDLVTVRGSTYYDFLLSTSSCEDIESIKVQQEKISSQVFGFMSMGSFLCRDVFPDFQFSYSTLTECSDAGTVSVSGNVGAFVDVDVEFMTPPSFNYKGNVTGGTELATDPVKIDLDINNGAFDFTFDLQAKCDAGDDDRIEFEFVYNGGLDTCTITSLQLVVEDITLVIPPEGTPGRNTESTLVAVLGETDTLTTTVVQEGVGTIDSLFYYVDDHPLLSLEKVIVCETGQELDVAFVDGGRTYFWMGEAAVGVDGFVRNEGVDICEIWLVDDCPDAAIPQIMHGAVTSCESNPVLGICDNAMGVAAIDYSLNFPEMTHYVDLDNGFDPSCPSESPKPHNWYLINTGDAPLGAISIRFAEYGGATPIDATSFIYTEGSSGTPAAVISGGPNTDIRDLYDDNLPGCISGLSNRGDLNSRVTIDIDNLNLPVGETLFVEYVIYPVTCGCSTCDVIRRYGVNISNIKAFDLCENMVQDGLLRSNVAWPSFDVNFSDFMETPVLNCAGDNSTLSVTVTNFTNDFLSNQGNSSGDDDERTTLNGLTGQCTTCFTEMTVTLPNGLDFVGPDVNWIDDDGTVWSADVVNYFDNDGGDDILIARWTGQEPSGWDAFAEGSGIFFDYTPDCDNELAKGPDCGPVLYEDEIKRTLTWNYEDCADCPSETFACEESISVLIKCPGSMTGCECAGFVQTFGEAERFNLYQPDSDNDGIPGPGTTYDDNLVRRDRFIKGDSIEVKMGGYVGTTASIPNFDYLYATVEFPNDEFIPIGGVVEIYPAGGGVFTCDVLTQQLLPGNLLLTDLSIARLTSNGCTVPTTYSQDDSIALTFYYRATEEFAGDVQFLQYTTRMFTMDGAYGVGTEYSCRIPFDYRLTQVGTQSDFDYFTSQLNNFEGCETGTPYYRGYSRIGTANLDYFPGEYIGFVERVNQFRATIPAGMVFNFFRIYIRAKNAGNANSLGSVIAGFPSFQDLDADHPAVTIIGNQLIFDMETYLLENFGSSELPFSDEGYSWSFQPYYIGTCDLTPGPLEEVLMETDHTTNPNIFCSSGYLDAGSRSDLNYQGGAEIVVEAVDMCIQVDQFPKCARVNIRNAGSALANNVWLSFVNESGYIIVDSVTNITGGGSTVIDGSEFNMYQLGNLPANGNILVDICTYPNICKPDTLIVISGYDCIEAPSIVEEALCSSSDAIEFKPLSAALSMISKVPDNIVLDDLCDTITYIVDLSVSGPGYLNHVNLDITLPSDLMFIPGSFEVAYPTTATGTSIPPDSEFELVSDPTLIYGNTYRLDVTGEDLDFPLQGLIGSDGSAFNLNVVNVRYLAETKCGFASGSRVFYEATASSGCGEQLIPTQKDFSGKMSIFNAPPPFLSEVNIQGDALNACFGESTTLEVDYGINGLISTMSEDSLRIVLPPGVNYVPGSYRFGTNPNTNPPSVVNESGLQVLYWGISNLMPGSMATFSIDIVAMDIGQECKEFPVIVQTFKSGPAYCDATMENCNVRSISDEDRDNILIQKPELEITGGTISAMESASVEMLMYEFEITNTGVVASTVDNIIVVDIYEDVNGNGRVEKGSDVLLGSAMVPAEVGPGETAIVSGSLDVPAGSTCSILAYLDVDKNCACKVSTSARLESDLILKFPKDILTCSNETMSIGPNNNGSYSYQWISLGGSDLSALSSTSTSPVDFTYDNNTGTTIEWDFGVRVSRAPGCYTFDTVTVTIYPETMGTLASSICGPIVGCGSGDQGFSLSGPLNGSGYLWSIVSGDMTAVIDDVNDPTTNVSSVLSEPTVFRLDYLDENDCGAVFEQTVTLINCACTALGDTVWYDFNVDGIQDPTEPGIEGITVFLYNSNDLNTPIQQTLTDVNGRYIFQPLPQGEYVIRFDTSGYSGPYHMLVPTGQNQGGDDTADSDADPISGYTGPYFLPNGISDTTVDAGFYPGFDLALIKEIDTDLSPGPYFAGDNLNYKITVINQGGYYGASDVTVVDYLVAELNYVGGSSGASTTSLGAPINITNNGGGSFTIDTLPPLDTVVLQLELMLDAGFTGSNLDNYAEISDFKNQYDLEDVDSNADAIDDNDRGGAPTTAADNTLNGNGTGIVGDGNAQTDEDDHDPARVSIAEVDLALRKKVNTTYNSEPVAIGELVKFDIILYNQGDVSVDSIEVVDYAPAGLSFDATNPLNVAQGWAANSKTVIRKRLNPGEIDTVCIYMLVDFSLNPDDYINAAEITAAWDTVTGREVAGFDIDSDPESNTANEMATTPGSLGDNNIISTGDGEVGSQDDHDVALVEVGYVDVALTKKVDTSVDVTNISFGDKIKFVIEVYNQGTLDGKSVQVTEYIPTGYSFDATYPGNSIWTVLNANTVETELVNLICNSSQRVCIWLTLERTSDPANWINYAEVSRFIDNKDVDRSDEDIDSPLNDDRTDNKGGAVNSPADDAIDGDGTGIIGGMDADTDQDNHDPAAVSVFDLALAKVVTTPGPYVYGVPVVFTMTIYNQGNTAATNVVVSDSIPEGYVLDVGGSPGWDDSNAPIHTFTYNSTTILPGASQDITISLIPVPTDGGPEVYTNRAEISSAQDEMGRDREDVDSDFDDDFGNDNGGEPDGPTDNEVDDDGSTDEDDADPARITFFDMALTKKLVNPAMTYLNGTMSEYDITVFNQGNEPATNVRITDYVPCGMSFIDDNTINPGWTKDVDSASYNVPGTILPGENVTVTLFLNVEVPPVGCMVGGDPFKNMSEITNADDRNGDAIEDVDSEPGSNGPGEQAIDPQGPGDNVIDMSTKGGNEDDHDPANLILFDLALSKVIDDSYNAAPYRLGETVKFDITITNQGNICTDSFQIIDHIPTGLEFNTALNTGTWTINTVGDTARYLYFDANAPVCFLETHVVSIYLDVVSTTDKDGYINYAEIEVARDVDDIERITDNDSNFDNDFTNDTGGVPGSDDDDEIDERGPAFGEDEDDHDPAEIQILDLALIKTINTPGPYDYGDTVRFDITIVNQGNLIPESITVSDYLPAGLEFSLTNQPEWSIPVASRSERTIDDPFAIDDDTTVSIDLIIREDDMVSLTSYTNIAEISDVRGPGGFDLNGYDVDSDPDIIPGDDEGGEPETLNDDRLDGNGTDDEDDHDPALLNVLDLALRKSFVDMMTPIIPGADVTFRIVVFNQGNIVPGEFTITDYMTPSLTLSGADTNGWTSVNDSTAQLTYSNDLLPGDSMEFFIVTTIDANPDLTDLYNFAEISDIRDDAGDDIADDEIDSTPDGERDNDNGGEVDGPTDDLIDDHGDLDEDDHDGARAGFVDLALFKTTDHIDPVRPGDDVVFDIYIVNQGIIQPGKIAIVDYIPDGFELSPNDVNNWMPTGTANNVVDTIFGPIAFMDTVSTTITLRVKDQVTPATLINIAEIKYVEDQFDNDISALDIDSTPNENEGDDAGGELGGATDDETLLEDPVDEDDHDPATAPLFDLAITKTTTQVLPAQWGETITFEICVSNQGNIVADSVEITDYIPAGLRLSTLDANGWTGVNDSTATNVITGTLDTNETICLFIDLVVQRGAQLADLRNTAEITAAEDDMDNDRDGDDFDSDPDNDDGDQSEDDEAGAEVMVFDLALRKTTNIIGPVEEGDTAIFFIGIFNQGNVTAVDAVVRDFVPLDLIFSPALNSQWMQVGGREYQYTFTDSLYPGDIDTVEIALIVAQDARTKKMINQAEIFSAGGAMTDLTDYDIDSQPNNDPLDDNGGEPFSPTDNEIEDNGFIDEDDADPEGLLICHEIACRGSMNFSLDENCEGILTADMLLSVVNFPLAAYEIRVMEKNGNPHPNFFDGSDVGRCFNVVVVNTLCESLSCWGQVCVESKFPPPIECRDTLITVACGESTEPEVLGFPLPTGFTATKVPGQNEYKIDSLMGCGELWLRFSDEMSEKDCDGPYYRTITRTWTIENQFGMTSTCEEEIGIEPGNFANVVFPPNYDGFGKFALECDFRDVISKSQPVGGVNIGWNSLSDGHPSPYDNVLSLSDTLIGTGFPTGTSCEHLAVSYRDRIIESCGENTYKLWRSWKVFDWCTGEDSTHIQTIKVVDTRAPEVLCPTSAPVIVPTTPWECTGSYIVPDPIFDPYFRGNPTVPVILRECNNWTYEIRHKVASVGTMSPDECANVDESETFFTTNVRQLPNGQWEVFDMPQGCNWIKYIITDECGNSVVCGLEVFVEDQESPVAVCDEHTVISLNEDGDAQLCAPVVDNGSQDNCTAYEELTYEIKKMGENDNLFRDCIAFTCADVAISPIMVVFRVYDKAGNYNDCMVEVTVQDKIAPSITCPDNIEISCTQDYLDDNLTGFPDVSDQCGLGKLTSSIVEEDLNDCGIGHVIKRWRVEDNGGRFDICDQRIDIVDYTLFNGRDIIWPRDYTVDGCKVIDAHPNNLPDGFGWPDYRNRDCAKPAAGFEDEVFYNVAGYCIKIVRTWEVIDWCQYDAQTGLGGKWTKVQTIYIENNDAPRVIGGCEDQTICADADCDGLVEFELEGTDDCTPSDELEWSYEVREISSGNVVDSGLGNSYSEELSRGRYRFSWTVKDGCANETTCTSDVHIRDCKEPTPYCKPGIVTTIMPSTGYVEIWASDFNDASFDNCTDTIDLRYSFSDDVGDRFRTIYCDDIEGGVVDTFTYEMWVTDLDGNQDYCTVTIIVQDNQNVCPNSGNITAAVGGLITTADNANIAAVRVDLMHSNVFAKGMETADDGNFAFYDLTMKEDYSVIPHKNDDHLNGVSTADIVLIQRHLLGKQDIDSPYKLIAADANNSESVSAADIAEIRKLILGVFSELPKNSSWRFIDAEYSFGEPTDPWIDPLKEVILYNEIEKDEMATNFVGVKVGDVNGDADVDGLGGNSTRSGELVTLTTNEEVFAAGQGVNVDITSEESVNIYGMQMTIELSDVEGVKIASGSMEIGEGQYHVNERTGVLTMTWSEDELRAFEAREVLFTITGTTIDAVSTSQMLKVSSSVTKAEAYLEDLEVAEIDLTMTSKDAEVNRLYQNVPNPFDRSTVIGFELIDNMPASLEIYSTDGVSFLFVKIEGKRGYNSIELNSDQLPKEGIYYYQLHCDNFTDIKKLIMTR